jgi:hypothetical protein
MSTRNSDREITRLLHLQREDAIAFWLRRAHEQARQLDLPVDFLGEAIGIVTNAVSASWIRAQIDKRRFGLMGAFTSNPLINALAIAGDSQLVTIVELAVYLKAFAQR